MLEVIRDLNQWKELRQKLKGSEKPSVGFVPTMGALHEGHASLLKKAKKENDLVVLSIYVNPTQFNNSNDLENYPKTWEQDLEIAESLGVDFILSPTYQQMYPDQYRYQVQEKQESQELCGGDRPGHFDGVLTVVMKLLNLVQPQKAYFGEKDHQQYELVRDMCQSFFMDVEIIPCPIVREENGLALSSRNQRLSEEDYQIAPLLYENLKNKKLKTDEISTKLTQLGFSVDYLVEKEKRRYVAATLGKTPHQVRLIDNVEI